MLTRSFCCFRGLSASAERKLWRRGCLDWHALPYASGVVSDTRMSALIDQLPELRIALEARLPGYFLNRLPVGHRLRVWPEFNTKTLFLDVETTGLRRDAELTVIGVDWGGQRLQYVRGVNLEAFLPIVSQAEMLVTFNGARFDWPMIERHFRLSLTIPHIDLMREARAYGLAGGLKLIEKRIGIVRQQHEAGDGALAVQLWHQFVEAGDRAALERLLRYNQRDVASLRTLARELLKRSLENYPGPLPTSVHELLRSAP